MGVAISVFNDFNKSTSPAFLTSAEDVLNEAARRNYLLRRFIKGRPPSEVLQGGRVIRDEVMFDEQSTAQFAHPDETFEWSQPQVLTEWEVRWRYLVDHKAWNDQIVEQNITPGMSQAGRHRAYKHIKYVLEQRMWTSLLNKKEDQMWAVPEAADMEAAAGKQPYSIPAFINANTNGLFYSGAQPTGKNAWTTVMNINPVTNPKWVPAVRTYSASTVGAGADNVLAAFDKMWFDVKFEKPGTRDEYFDRTELYQQFIVASPGGVNVYQRLLRDSQDHFAAVSRQDPAYVSPMYGGIDVERVDILTNAALYSNSTSTNPYQTEVSTTADERGPRYYWLNAQYLKMIWHSRNYMDVKDVKEHPNQVFTHVQPVASWYNMVARSRQRLGLVKPSGDRYDANYAAI